MCCHIPLGRESSAAALRISPRGKTGSVRKGCRVVDGKRRRFEGDTFELDEMNRIALVFSLFAP